MSSPSSPPPHGPARLTPRERHALELMVHHECRHDPRFVDRLTTWSAPAPRAGVHADGERTVVSRALVLLGGIVVITVLVGLAVTGFAMIAVVGALAMIMIPAALVGWSQSQSQDRRPPRPT